MSVRVNNMLLLSSAAFLSFAVVGGNAWSQAPDNNQNPPANPSGQGATPQATPTQTETPPGPGNLPTVNVETSKQKPAPKKQAVVRRPPATPVAQPATAQPQQTQAERQNQTFDTARSNLYTTVGTNTYAISHESIQQLPQGTNTPIDKVLLQAPGFSQDSTASGSFHLRNDHANVQFRINGVMLPDGVTGFSQVIDSGLIGGLSVVTGALPAEFGLRTVGIVDITTRADAFNNSGSVSLYGGSRGTFEPSIEYGATFGGNCGLAKPVPGTFVKAPPADCWSGVQYFFTGRYLQTTEGIENPISALNAIHDFSRQEKGFGYMSTFIDPSTRLSLITGTAIGAYQIPNSPNQPVGASAIPVTDAFGVTNFDSSQLNENQTERTHYAVLALQKSAPGFDGQVSYFTRYNELHYTPDVVGDLLFNGISSEITRRSLTNGVQGDGSFALNPAHTLRAGFTVSAEHAFVADNAIVEPCTICDGSDNGPPTGLYDASSITGWLAGVYVQDEWRVTDRFTINAGLRFDQMYQYVDANQLSPRISFTYRPFQYTMLHAGYARFFTPPVLVEAAPTNLALYQDPNNNFAPINTGAPPGQGNGNSPLQPERAHYFDAGIKQQIPLGCSAPATTFFTKVPLASKDCAMLELGVDAYYKLATDLLDNGQFGQALVLQGFNYEKGYNKGLELSGKFTSGPFQAYANFAWAVQKATNVVSNQFLFDNVTPDPNLGGLSEFQYIQNNYIYTDHAQLLTGSAGISYLWYGTRFSADAIYGSGLRSGPANTDHQAPYGQINAGVSHEFVVPDWKPFTLRFDVVNVFDTIYQLRDGSGIGVFAPQYGPRRGYFAGWTQKL